MARFRESHAARLFRRLASSACSRVALRGICRDVPLEMFSCEIKNRNFFYNKACRDSVTEGWARVRRGNHWKRRILKTSNSSEACEGANTMAMDVVLFRVAFPKWTCEVFSLSTVLLNWWGATRFPRRFVTLLIWSLPLLIVKRFSLLLRVYRWPWNWACYVTIKGTVGGRGRRWLLRFICQLCFVCILFFELPGFGPSILKPIL